MKKIPVIVIFDIGKTNKKIVLFNEQYQVVYEASQQLEELRDEDGFPCEDIAGLTEWISRSFEQLLNDERFNIRAVNFSAYGASFVYLDEDNRVAAPLYNYLKPYPTDLQKKFYQSYGGETAIAKQTASPVLGSLNAGMQLYRVKHEQPALFKNIKWALHLPQYASFVITGRAYSDITSVGCHTHLWDFQHHRYHSWVEAEGLHPRLPSLLDCKQVAGRTLQNVIAGGGLHDSSAALIPYLATNNDPFLLVSTGTWCISLNPFNHSQLTNNELNQDCLSYLAYDGKPVKASRLFAGYEHEQQVKRLGEHFQKQPGYYATVGFDPELSAKCLPKNEKGQTGKYKVMVGQSVFVERDLQDFESYAHAYHQLITDIIQQQIKSINLIRNGTPARKIFVDGGFSKNPIYMQLLADAYPAMDVYASSVAQASALGAAMAIHAHWNNCQVPKDLLDVKLYSNTRETIRG